MHFLLGLRCPCCNEELDSYELQRYDELEGMKEECFNESIKAAYEELPDIFGIEDIDS